MCIRQALPRDSNCSCTFGSILFNGHSILTFTEVDEGLLLAVGSTCFLGVNDSSEENCTEGLGTYIDSSLILQLRMSCDLQVEASSNSNSHLLANFSAGKQGQLKFISCSNGSSHPFEKIHQPFERLEISVRKKSSAVRTARVIHSRKFISRLNICWRNDACRHVYITQTVITLLFFV